MSTLKDPLDQFDDDDFRRMKWLEKRPICEICKEHVQDDFYYQISFGGMEFKACERCIQYFRKDVE